MKTTTSKGKTMEILGFGSLLTIDGNPKIIKGDKKGEFLTAIMHLAPATLSGHNVCASASAGCVAACLNTAGRGAYNKIQQTRIARTKLWFSNRELFKELLNNEVAKFQKRCKRKGVRCAIRLNGTSDIVWEKTFPELFTDFPRIQFYDYTKHYKRCLKKWKLPNNYHLTFSRCEDNETQVKRILRSGKVNVAAVFSSDMPESYLGYPVYNADADDMRFLDPPGGHIGYLKAKGKAKRDKSGFVIHSGGVV